MQWTRRCGAVLALVWLGCSGDEVGDEVAQATAVPATRPAPPTCAEPLPVFEEGQVIARLCPEQAREQGYTVVDLSDDWVPFLFRSRGVAGDPLAEPSPGYTYADTYVALANQRFGDGPEWDRARQDRYLELYGIPPSFARLAERLRDETRFACHAFVDSSALAGVKKPIDVFDPPHGVLARAAVAALERRLVCDGLLPVTDKQRKRWRLQDALETYQRKHTIISRGQLDAETRRTLAADPRELELRALLRALRARVVDATGLIEDGSATGERSRVLGRRIDGEEMYISNYDALEEGAPDLVSPAVEAAARALGWTDAHRAVAFFDRQGPGATERLLVALPLPAPPGYHGPHMDLRAEIDRGDVYYDRPHRRGRIERRPSITLWTRTEDGRDVALVRWPTTIGGWKREVSRAGNLVLKYKNSDVGPRMWRDLIAAPAWIPPPTTPPRVMVRRSGAGKWIADTQLTGPGYSSAYGLVMMVHHQVRERRGRELWDDNGIRTHGSVSYHSILRGESHGCHRLFNRSAVELASFLLRHRAHVDHGLDERKFTRVFRWKGRRVALPIVNRGQRYEFTPPVAVEVLRGEVKGRKKRVPRRPLYVRR